MPLKKSILLTPRPICKICFKDIPRQSLISFFDPEIAICDSCFDKMNYSISRGRIDSFPIMSLATYGEPLRSLLLRFKESNDVELGPVFLSYYKTYLRLIYLGYSLVCVPSSPSKLAKRGFNHLHEIFKPLKMPFLDVLTKDETLEQKKKNAVERKEAAGYFHIHDGEKIRGKRILLVDDVVTTSASLRASIDLLIPFKPKSLKILVVMNDAPLDTY